MVLLRDVVAMLGELYAVRPELMLELTSPAPRIEDVVLPGVAEQMAGCDPSILVLDDLDQVTHPDSLVIVSFLIEHAPAGSQLVLVSRTEPEVPLARLRAAGEVLDLRAADLAFDARETGALLGDGGVVLSDEEVDQIRGRAEGWATGMALAMLSPDGPSIALGRPAIALGGSLEVAAYLLEEAVGGQPAERRAFLFGSSLLRRMSASLCDAALGIENSGRMIAALERESLFIVALNGDGEWYGYHDLFRELLESEMQRQSPDLVAGILRRAAAWHDERGDTREVVRVRVHRGDLERAGRILLRSGESLIARGQIETVRGWMGRCTREEMGSNPQLALAGAWIALLSGEAAEASWPWPRRPAISTSRRQTARRRCAPRWPTCARLSPRTGSRRCSVTPSSWSRPSGGQERGGSWTGARRRDRPPPQRKPRTGDQGTRSGPRGHQGPYRSQLHHRQLPRLLGPGGGGRRGLAASTQMGTRRPRNERRERPG